MNIRSKLVVTLSVALLVNLAVGLYAAYTYKRVMTRAAEVRDRSSQIVALSLTAQVDFKKQVQEWKNVLLRGHEPDLYDKYLSQFYAEERLTAAAMEELLPLLDEHSEAERIAGEFISAHRRLGVQYRDALQYYKAAQAAPHIVVDLRVRGIDRLPTDLLDEVVKLTLAYKQEQLAQIQAEVSRLERETLLLALGAVTLALLLLVWLTDRLIARPIAAATAIARRISGGDLSSPIRVQGRDEAGALLDALSTMQGSLAASQQTLKESEARIRLLLDSTGEGIYGVDREGRCMFCNPAGARMLGQADAEALLGRDMHALIHYRRADGSAYPHEECRASLSFRVGRAIHVDDEVFWRADGTSFPVEYGSYPIERGGGVIGAVVTFADITERRRSERALSQAHEELREERALLAQRVHERTAELNSANVELAQTARAKDQFLAAMSHELRTPLTTVMGLTEMLADQLYGPLSGAMHKPLETISESARHLLDLINDILDVAKAEAGKMELDWDDVPVAQLCEASLRLVKQQALRKGLHLAIDLDPNLSLVRGDSRRLKQLLLNLLGNAVKFTPDGGSIGLETAADPAAGMARFTVWDTGIGIPPEQREALFTPFVQVAGGLSGRHDGTGLGLALVQHMAQLHHGSVSVQSEPEKGSRFSVLIPWEAAVQALASPEPGGDLAAPAAGGEAVAGNAVILVVEDNEANLRMLSDYLAMQGFGVTTARDGDEALAQVRARVPDLVLMDIQLPGTDGLEAVRRMRGDADLKRVPILALTALAMPGDRERCLEAGVDDYLAKPVGMRELLQNVRSRLPRR